MLNRKRLAAAAISVALCALALCGCAGNEPASASEPAQPEFTFILIADGQIRVATSTEADSIADVLEHAGITLNEGDMLSVQPDQKLASGMVVEVLRHATVRISLSAKSFDTKYTVSLVGATVGDALRAVGIDLADILSSNYDFDVPLVNDMQIEVSSSAAPAVEVKEEASSSSSGSSRGGGGGGGSSASSGGSSGGSSSSSGRTVVSTERYDDCDGSGHGVMVITYSDGTQEERPY